MNIKDIISKMTLEEKASLCSGLNNWETKAVERLGVLSIMMTDGPHGLRKVVEGTDEFGKARSYPSTCFPTAVLSACSFDTDLLREMGAALGEECVAEQVRIILGPGVEIKRSPLCGRNFEYFSEDPYLAGEMGAAFIQGVQSKGVGTCIKHFAANNQETRRFSSDSRIDERTLREIYLSAFEKAAKAAQPATFMCSYNRVNGEYAAENHRLLTKILRDEWGFEGVVISDWGAVNDRVKGIIAGLDLEMPGGTNPNDALIVSAVRSGALSEATLDITVERLLNLVNNVVVRSATTAYDVEKHDALARKVAAESMVLLKNEGGTLPLKRDVKIAFIGEFAETPRYQGGGSSQVNPTKLTSALDAAEAYGDVTYCRGYTTNNCDEPDAILEAEAIAVAKDADVCVLFIGLPVAYETEGLDRAHMGLPGGQNHLVEAVVAVNPNVVVVLYNGSPVEMPWADRVSAILEAYLGGQAGGGAVADLLFGAANPCGKLAESFPIKLSDTPSYLYYLGEGDIAEYREGIFVGYRYYDAKEMAVRFPFGHGLSYTTFEYANLYLSAVSMDDTETLTVTVDVTNMGSMAGKEVVQLYVGPKERDDRVIRAPKQLKGFRKVSLQPGETKTVSFALEKRAFAYYNTQISDWYVLTGDYRVMVGTSSREIALEAEISVNSTVKLPFRADVNTTVRDILRMDGGRALIAKLTANSPVYGNMDTSPEPGTIEYMLYSMLPDMVIRMVRMLGDRPDLSLEELQAMLDEHIND
ncbi:MAG: glycoside hydrolase family 3 C-terminal domain-containing protein [Oscillospiraceae bacterium]|nr:glycoside hydrolase family 3 C-terminal domain-containing protein [Oscillospiraceae bacterium]